MPSALFGLVGLPKLLVAVGSTSSQYPYGNGRDRIEYSLTLQYGSLPGSLLPVRMYTVFFLSTELVKNVEETS